MIYRIGLGILSGILGLASISRASSGRVIYLNGIDISAAKNQALEQVNVRIDAQGHIYIEAPQYEVQQETSFVPLSGQMPGHPSLPEHKAPGPLTRQVETPAQKLDLASPPETGDTMDQAEATSTVSNASSPTEKEGTRKPPDGNPSKDGTATALPTAQKPNP
ncbi:MAG: hypothetical protein NTX25_18775 [Proteobacteria bacterium]|nr:hypothetical protein [Pseudomonadota bacterium]